MQCVEWIVPGLPRCRQPRAPPGEGPEKMSLLAGGPDPRPSTRQKMRLPIGRAAAIDKTSRRHIFPPRFRWRGAACRPLPEREREREGRWGLEEEDKESWIDTKCLQTLLFFPLARPRRQQPARDTTRHHHQPPATTSPRHTHNNSSQK